MSDHYGIVRQRLWRDYRFAPLEPEAKLYYLQLLVGPPRICVGLAHDGDFPAHLAMDLKPTGLVEIHEHGFFVLPEGLRDDPPANADHLLKLVRTVVQPSVPPGVQRAWINAVRTVAPDKLESFIEKHPTVWDTVPPTVGGPDPDPDPYPDPNPDPVGNTVAPDVATALAPVANGAKKRDQQKVDAIAEWEIGLAKELDEASPEARAWIVDTLLPEFLQVLRHAYEARGKEFTLTRAAQFAKRFGKYDALVQATAMEIYVDLDGGQGWEYVCGIAKRLHDEERLEKKTVKASLIRHRNHNKQGLYARWMQEARHEQAR